MIRRADKGDIERIMEVRASVRENRLRDPSRVTVKDVGSLTIPASSFGWKTTRSSAFQPLIREMAAFSRCSSKRPTRGAA
jgi:hypothetical protein